MYSQFKKWLLFIQWKRQVYTDCLSQTESTGAKIQTDIGTNTNNIFLEPVWPKLFC
jgi:hypothetical protein